LVSKTDRQGASPWRRANFEGSEDAVTSSVK